MSAYVVEKDLIDTLIAGALEAGFFGADKATEKGKMLWRENVTSVAFRYNLASRDPGELAEYDADVADYAYRACSPERREVIAAIDCLDYQSCEHDAWPTSEACNLLELLRAVV